MKYIVLALSLVCVSLSDGMNHDDQDIDPCMSSSFKSRAKKNPYFNLIALKRAHSSPSNLGGSTRDISQRRVLAYNLSTLIANHILCDSAQKELAQHALFNQNFRRVFYLSSSANREETIYANTARLQQRSKAQLKALYSSVYVYLNFISSIEQNNND